MTQIKTKIPAELEPVAVGGMVADAKHIIDRVKNKNQTEVNAATDASINQLSNEIDAVNTQDIVPVDSLPAVGSADPRKIYRVVGETSYTDNMVNAAGDGWKELAVYTFPGIDDVPTAGSDNLVKSGGVFNSINAKAIELLWQDGYYIKTDTSPIDDTMVVNASFSCIKMKVSEGEIWNIKGQGGGNPRLYAVTDSSNNPISGYVHYGTSLVEVVITMPQNAAYLYLNAITSVEHFAKRIISSNQIGYTNGVAPSVVNIKDAADDLYQRLATQRTDLLAEIAVTFNVAAESTNGAKFMKDFGYDTYYSPINPVLVSAQGICGAKIEVKQGEVWKITGRGSGHYRRYAVINENNELIEGYYSLVTDTDIKTDIITIPANGKYLLLNTAYEFVIPTAVRFYESENVTINDNVPELGTTNLQTAINKLSIPYHKMGLYDLVNGYGYNADFQLDEIPAYSCAKVKVEAGQTWFVKGTASFNYRIWRVVDSNGDVIPGFEALGNSNPQEKMLIMPTDAQYLYFNTITAEPHSLRMVEKITPSSSIVYVAASNSSTLDKNNADYVCTGVGDQDVINAAIASLEKGGTVHLMAGDYNIDAFTNISGMYPCAIEVKDNGNPRYIIIEGVRPTFPLISGTRIIVTDDCYNSLDNDTQVAVISQDYSVRQLGYFFRNAMTIRDLMIELPNCTKPVICISQFRTVYGGCEGVICYNRATYHYVYEESSQDRDTYAPTPNAKSIAFSGVATTNSWYYMRFDECFAQGFAIGYDISGDHIVMRNCVSSRNILGYSFGKFRECFHHITLINCCSETDCQYMFFGKGLNEKEPIVIENFQIEHPLVGGPNAEYKLCEEQDVSNPQYCGTITYASMPNRQFFENGNGKTFRVTNLRNNPSGTYAQKPEYPNFLEEFFNIDTNKMMVYEGTNWRYPDGSIATN